LKNLPWLVIETCGSISFYQNIVHQYCAGFNDQPKKALKNIKNLEFCFVKSLPWPIEIIKLFQFLLYIKNF